jgi:NTP pyrophosphatase (non-canonical NTP hydrolase)
MAELVHFVAGTEGLEIMQDALVSRFNSTGDQLGDWSESDLGCALAGEVGELCNNLKKRRRKAGSVTKKECGKEMADVLSYLLLLAEKMNIDLGKATIDKYNEVSKRRKSNLRMKVNHYE